MLSKQGTIGLVVCTISMVMLGLAPTQRKRPTILGSSFKLVFHACEGLRDGDPVTIGGVDAGRVINIDFAPESDWAKLNPPGDERPVVLVTVALRQGFPISPGSGYKVVSTLRGRHFINIIPSPPGEEQVQANSILNQEFPSETEDRLQATIRNFRVLSHQTKDMREQFADPVFRRDMKDLASNMRFYSAEFVRISQDSRKQVEKMQRQLELQEQSLLTNVHKMDHQSSRVAGYMRTFVPAFRQQLIGYRQQLNASQKQLDQMYISADKYVKVVHDFGNTLEKGPLGTLDVGKLAQQVHDMKKQIEFYGDITGDMHTVSSDPTIQKDLKAIPKKYKAQTEKLKEQIHGYEEKVDAYKWLIPEEHK